jgi:hypothetical protein
MEIYEKELISEKIKIIFIMENILLGKILIYLMKKTMN